MNINDHFKVSSEKLRWVLYPPLNRQKKFLIFI